ncbi:Transposase IS4 [Popillia japonica]|uniref:Transposase IS4 n=1 Tax=Popillia japonica TaxID=7064 RepID=A0AAW1HVK5_POPJA
MVIRWMDNSEVTIATNYDTIEPMVTVQRFSKEKKKKVGVPQPLAFNNYNRYMGGVDLHDNGVANYRIGIRGKKYNGGGRYGSNVWIALLSMPGNFIAS